MKEEFDKIIAELQAIKDKQSKEIAYVVKADCCGPESCVPDWHYDCQYIHNRCDYIMELIEGLYRRMYEQWDDHLQGHFPTGLSPGELQTAIDKLNLGKSFEVMKRMVYADDGTPKKLIIEIGK